VDRLMPIGDADRGIEVDWIDLKVGGRLRRPFHPEDRLESWEQRVVRIVRLGRSDGFAETLSELSVDLTTSLGGHDADAKSTACERPAQRAIEREPVLWVRHGLAECELELGLSELDEARNEAHWVPSSSPASSWANSSSPISSTGSSSMTRATSAQFSPRMLCPCRSQRASVSP